MVKEVSNVIKKILVVMIIFQIMFMPISNGFSLEDIFKKGDKFLEEGKHNQTIVSGYEIEENEGEVENVSEIKTHILNEAGLKKTIKEFYKVILTIGVVISVIVGAILGIKFMVGSVEEQAKIKEILIPYVIGCIVTFGAFGIWSVVINIGQSTEPVAKYEVTGSWYWCSQCDTYWEQSKGKTCSKNESHTVKERTKRYYCSTCGDEWDEGERRSQHCDECSSGK